MVFIINIIIIITYQIKLQLFFFKMIEWLNFTTRGQAWEDNTRSETATSESDNPFILTSVFSAIFNSILF